MKIYLLLGFISLAILTACGSGLDDLNARSPFYLTTFTTSDDTCHDTKSEPYDDLVIFSELSDGSLAIWNLLNSGNHDALVGKLDGDSFQGDDSQTGSYGGDCDFKNDMTLKGSFSNDKDNVDGTIETTYTYKGTGCAASKDCKTEVTFSGKRAKLL